MSKIVEDILLKIMITGNLGYLGPILTKLLLSRNFEVVGLDGGYFYKFFSNMEYGNKFQQIIKDIRDVSEDDLNGVHSVIHLAGLSNDPSCELNVNLTNEINFMATKRLAKLSKRAKVKRFLFSSSCSVYGATNELALETSENKPLTIYAKSKILSENAILELTDKDFVTTILRSGTAFGVAPRLRLDLVINSLTAKAFTSGSLRLSSGVEAWRPFIHVREMARAFLLAISAESDVVNGQIFNVGNTSENYQIKKIAKIISEIVPDTKLEFADNATVDKRSYRIGCKKIKETLGFIPEITVREGIKELYEFLRETQFKKEDYYKKEYHIVEYYKMLLASNEVDENLRFRTPENKW